MYFEVKETQSDWVPIRLGDRSDWISSPDWVPIRLSDRSDWISSPDWVPVRLDDRSDWYPVTQSETGTGASLVAVFLNCFHVPMITPSASDD